MLVDLDWLATVKLRLREIDQVDLADIEWVKDGQKVEQPSEELIEFWDFTGLRNTDFPEHWEVIDERHSNNPYK